MHPKTAALIAFCDAEAGEAQSRRIAGHLAGCEACREQVRRIRSENEDLAACAAAQAPDSGQGLAGVRSAMAAWREGRAEGAASELKSRLRSQVATYFGSPAILVVDRPGIPAEELLGRTGEMFDVFLGPEAAEAVTDDVFRGLDWAEIFR
jgi:hypothetical protein